MNETSSNLCLNVIKYASYKILKMEGFINKSNAHFGKEFIFHFEKFKTLKVHVMSV